jgi:hypothetical protein
MADSAPRRLGIQPFDREMIKDHLDRAELKYLIDQDGDYRVDFAAAEEGQPELSFWLSAEGTNEDIFVIRCVTNIGIDKTMWPQAAMACNQWNTEKRYPKAYLWIGDDPETLFGQMRLESQYPVGAGVIQPLIDDWITTMFGTSFQFWEWLGESGFMSVSPIEETPND